LIDAVPLIFNTLSGDPAICADALTEPRVLDMLALSGKCREAILHWDRIQGPPRPENARVAGIPVYESTFVDRFLASAHPITPIVWYGPVIAYALYAAAQDPAQVFAVALLLYGGGVLLWTLLEYLLHRFLFHKTPPRSFATKKFLFLLHGYHHEFPNHKTRLVAPPLMSWLIGGLIALLCYLILGSPYWLVVFAGITSGYVAYDWIHYYTHHFRPRTRLGRFIKRHHLRHHYKHPDANFGISSPLWDFVFGTFRDEKAAGPG
jgi:sterol desaturase/sphingolipid hydroxylase (fatty acid hydroxylase superfamily)